MGVLCRYTEPNFSWEKNNVVRTILVDYAGEAAVHGGRCGCPMVTRMVEDEVNFIWTLAFTRAFLRNIYLP